METGTVVVRKDGTKGIIINDSFNCCGPNEVAVVYEGSTAFLGTDVEDLEVIGPENAKADMEKCGAGKGEECCIFLTIGSNGPGCERFGSLRDSLIFRRSQMRAKREPDKLFPNCQLS